MFKRDYKIIISFTNNDELMWDVQRNGEPHFVGNNKEELLMVKESCEEVITHINRLLITDNFELEGLKVHDTMPIKPKFKPDDIIRAKDDGEKLKIYAVNYSYYTCSGGVAVEFKDQDEWELVNTGKSDRELSQSEVTKTSDQDVPDGELTEFEKKLLSWFRIYNPFSEHNEQYAIDAAEELLSIARKQFIEEAWKYLDEHLYDEVCYEEIRPDIVSTFIEDFRKALEGMYNLK